MSIKELQGYTYYSRYARHNGDKKRRETWQEAVDRMLDMHLRRYPNVKEEIEWIRPLVREKRFLGSQRALQFGGKPVERKHARLYNCSGAYCDRPRFFQEALWMLLCGSGVGFSVQKHHVAKLPKIQRPDYQEKETYVIPDSIEGWADSLGILLACYMPHPEYPEWYGKNVVFDFSEIRPAGSYLSSGVGKAPGPKPLMLALERVRELLDKCVQDKPVHLRPIDVYDIVMHASDAVLSGGVRRSATICLFSADDEDMLKAKTGNWRYDNPQRARSNNSVLLLREETTKEQFESIVGFVKEYGEPGFIWADDVEALFNPCFHKDTRLCTENGLIRIEELYQAQKPVNVVVDTRMLEEGFGTKVLPASKVHLTKKNTDIYKITTEYGHEIRATEYHEFITPTGRAKLKDLEVGNSLWVQSGQGDYGKVGNYNQGLILGLITGDGTFSSKERNDKSIQEAFVDVWSEDFDQLDAIEDTTNKVIEDVPTYGNGDRNYGTINWVGNDKKNRIGGVRLYRFLETTLNIANPKSIKNRVPECVWQGTKEFVIGYLQGLFFSDGSVLLSGKNKKATLTFRLNQSNKALLQDVQILLNNFGINSKIYPRRKEGFRYLPDGHGELKQYWCKSNYDLIISRPNAIVFQEEINWIGRKKQIAESCLDIRGKECRKKERFISKIVNIEYDCTDDVYCLCQKDTNSVIANGLVTGQCAEIGMWAYLELEDGSLVSGWQVCNLCEINGKKITCKEDYALAARGAAILGTLQAGYTDFDYLGSVSEEIIRKEALLGVSITGMMDNPDVIFNQETQKEMARLVVKTNEWMAKKIGINPAARCTCVKPAGTTSCILGTASGIHPHHATRYLRRVQGNSLEPVLQHFKKYNPIATEKSVWAANDTDEVITFCVEVPAGAKTKNQLSAIELLEHVKETQQNWVVAGKRKSRCTQEWLSHNVSNTINVRPEEWDEVATYIYKNRKWFAGIALLPQSGDLDYPQAPMVTVRTPREILSEYGDGALMASGLIVDGLHAYKGDLWKACDVILGIGEELGGPPDNGEYDVWVAKTDWVRRVQQFAERYCDGDLRRCCYLMKEVNNWKLWLDLHREYKDVDYESLVEEEDNCKPAQEWACSGGKCEMV